MWLTAIHDSSFRGSNTFFWSLRALRICIAQTYMPTKYISFLKFHTETCICTHRHTQQLLFIKSPGTWVLTKVTCAWDWQVHVTSCLLWVPFLGTDLGRQGLIWSLNLRHLAASTRASPSQHLWLLGTPAQWSLPVSVSTVPIYCIDGWMDEWVDKWVNEWMNEFSDQWLNGR